MDEPFYRALEDRFRCSRAVIKTRCASYAPFLLPLPAATGSVRALDIGCGRGEWLEYAREQGFTANGVDLDTGMVRTCRELGLQAEVGDALQHLEQLPDASHALITAFHVAEHLPFDYLQSLVQQALRVLAPGGLLILETPNAENLGVGTVGFYLDPTHQRPIPQLLLAFVAEYAGFARGKILGLQEPEGLGEQGAAGLYHVVHGVSPDYALVAQKAAPAGQQALLDAAFARPYGLSLDTLLVRFDTRLERALLDSQQAQADARPALAAAERAQGVAEQAQAAAEQAQAAAEQAQAAAEHAQAVAAAHLAQLQAIYASRTWRALAPLRHALAGWRRFAASRPGVGAWRRFQAAPQRVAVHLARHALAWVRARPGLQQRIVALAQRLGMYALLRRLYQRWVHPPGPNTEAPFSLHTDTGPSPWSQHMAQRLLAARRAWADQAKGAD